MDHLTRDGGSIYAYINTADSPSSSSLSNNIFLLEKPHLWFSPISFPNSAMPMLVVALLIFSFAVLTIATDFSAIDVAGKPFMRSDEQVKGLYEQWLARHGKTYNGVGEKDKRFDIFKDNLKFIDEHNTENRIYKVGLNQFADLTNEEYKSTYLGTRIDAKRRFVKSKSGSQRYLFRTGDRLPESVDWRKNGAVAPIKNQGTCGQFTFFSSFFWYSIVLTQSF